MPTIEEIMSNCTLCPRQCHADRLHGQVGFCGMPADLVVARASLHMWEEPCISGASGSGTVFFTGCNMKCVFCQNRDIALTPDLGKTLSIEDLSQVFLRLQNAGANNINLVTASHYIPQVADALRMARSNGLSVPIVYNTSSYEEVWALKLLDGLVDIYLPDLKYYSSELSGQLSKAPDYYDNATKALSEMFRQVGPIKYEEDTEFNSTPDSNTNTVYSSDEYDDLHLLRKGMIVRHLVLPGHLKDSKKVLRYLHETYQNQILVSVMSQYTPLPGLVCDYPELSRSLTSEEYDRIIDFVQALQMDNVFIQEGGVASESFIPDFHDPSLL